MNEEIKAKGGATWRDWWSTLPHLTPGQTQVFDELLEAEAKAVREDCAKRVEGMKMGRSPIGPLHKMGWNECVERAAKRIRE